MSEQTLSQIELLLEQMGSVETTEDTTHRYALRRTLLRSSQFERHRIRVIWKRLFAYTTTLVVGGAVMAVVVIGVMTVEFPDEESASVAGPSSALSGELVERTDEPFGIPWTIGTAPRQTVAPIELASFGERPEVRHVIQFATMDGQPMFAR